MGIWLMNIVTYCVHLIIDSYYLVVIIYYLRFWNVVLKCLSDLYNIWQIKGMWLHKILSKPQKIFYYDSWNTSIRLLANIFHVKSGFWMVQDFQSWSVSSKRPKNVYTNLSTQIEEILFTTAMGYFFKVCSINFPVPPI